MWASVTHSSLGTSHHKFPCTGCRESRRTHTCVDVAIRNSNRGLAGQQQPKHSSAGCKRGWMLSIMCRCLFHSPSKYYPMFFTRSIILWKGSGWVTGCFCIWRDSSHSPGWMCTVFLRTSWEFVCLVKHALLSFLPFVFNTNYGQSDVSTEGTSSSVLRNVT